jgi:glycosyltransferase involved in cell wall biosynthesis
MPRLSVVVPARNEEAYIGALLETVFAQDPAPDEVMVVDNGSKDATAAIARRLGARVIRVEEPGVHRARQAGLRAAQGEIVAQTDADCRVYPGWTAAILEAFADPEVVASYGPIELFEAPWPDRILARYGFPLFLRLTHALGQPNLSGANHAVLRQAALAVGGYDRPFAEDVHLGLKLRGRGKIRYQPKQRVATSGRRLKGGRLKLYGVHAKNLWRRFRGLEEDYGEDYFAQRDR